MTRVEFDDGTVMWRRSLVAKILWGVGIIAWFAAAALVPDVEPDKRVVLILVGAGAAVLAWTWAWRPHLAATRDGLVVRRAMSAVLIAWPDIVEAQVAGNHGVAIRVRSGEILSSVVPRRGALRWFFDIESEADEAAAFINERASAHREPPVHPAVTRESVAQGSVARGAAEPGPMPALGKAQLRPTAGHQRLIAFAVLVVSVATGGLLINQTNRIDASFEELRHSGVATPAHVEGAHVVLGFVWWPVEYTYAGTTYREDVSCGRFCFDQGEEITLYVDPRNPARFITDSGHPSASSAQYLVAVLTLAGLSALFAAGYLFRQWIIRLPEPTRGP